MSVPRLFPRHHGSLGEELSSERSDSQNPLFPAVSVSPLFRVLRGIGAGPLAHLTTA